eukprot:gnl/TRDRNA2_/TRDRNA2_50922_c0_seq1.p1 gnl/TRDRNA2_/TRDRNA2_50922_c0~~gnl/TRDRNA2_/TRDRNA2_50922_c0_seq1.p1  ORF type:complete len:339 (+),score=76.78 gnl/TRDRNA2_/TRDRNA2_50922_c0_seq1:45-1019(+)
MARLAERLLAEAVGHRDHCNGRSLVLFALSCGLILSLCMSLQPYNCSKSGVPVMSMILKNIQIPQAREISQPVTPGFGTHPVRFWHSAGTARSQQPMKPAASSKSDDVLKAAKNAIDLAKSARSASKGKEGAVSGAVLGGMVAGPLGAMVGGYVGNKLQYGDDKASDDDKSEGRRSEGDEESDQVSQMAGASEKTSRLLAEAEQALERSKTAESSARAALETAEKAMEASYASAEEAMRRGDEAAARQHLEEKSTLKLTKMSAEVELADAQKRVADKKAVVKALLQRANMLKEVMSAGKPSPSTTAGGTDSISKRLRELEDEVR